VVGFGLKRRTHSTDPHDIEAASAQVLRSAIAPSRWSVTLDGATTLFFEGRGFSNVFLLNTVEVSYE
jgi:hypothetical protein